MTKDPIAIIIDIIRTYMGLTNDQIWQYNSAKVMPNTNGVFVVVDFLASKPYSVTTDNSVSDLGDYQETVTVQNQEMFSIDIFSRDSTARTRKEEIIAALAANYSLRQQEIYSFKIAKVAHRLNNVSQQDGGSMLNKFVIDTTILTWYTNTKIIEYYDQFPASEIFNS